MADQFSCQGSSPTRHVRGCRGRSRGDAAEARRFGAVKAGRPPARYAFTSLTPTARGLLEAAHRVLERDGYEGLTLRRIADEAGETKSLIIYHFENKAGLVAHLVDFLWHDADVALRERVESVHDGTGGRLEALIDLHERLALDTGAYRSYFELLPHVARDEETRTRVVGFYRGYRAFGTDCILSVTPDEAAAVPLAAALLAIGEGVPVQTLLLAEPAPAAAVFGLLRDVMRAYLGLGAGDRVGRWQRPPSPLASPARVERIRRSPGPEQTGALPWRIPPPISRRWPPRCCAARRPSSSVTVCVLSRWTPLRRSQASHGRPSPTISATSTRWCCACSTS